MNSHTETRTVASERPDRPYPYNSISLVDLISAIEADFQHSLRETQAKKEIRREVEEVDVQLTDNSP